MVLVAIDGVRPDSGCLSSNCTLPYSKGYCTFRALFRIKLVVFHEVPRASNQLAAGRWRRRRK